MRLAAADEFLHHDARLDGLAQAHLVGQDAAAAHLVQDLDGRLDLVGQNLDLAAQLAECRDALVPHRLQAVGAQVEKVHLERSKSTLGDRGLDTERVGDRMAAQGVLLFPLEEGPFGGWRLAVCCFIFGNHFRLRGVPENWT